MNEKAKNIALNIAVAGLITILLIWGNTFYRQWVQFDKGETALSSGDIITAIAGYEASIHMYTPFSPIVSRAADRLWWLAEELEKKGDKAKALVAYRALRSSFYSARGLYTPGQSRIDQCEARIAALINTPLPAQLKSR